VINVCVLVGRLATDPELKYTPKAVPCCQFRLAVDRDYINKTTGKHECDFLDVVCWRQQAEVVANYLTKGRLVGIEGSLQVSTWKAKDGGNRRNVQVVVNKIRFLDSAKGSARADMEGTPYVSPEVPSLDPANDMSDEQPVLAGVAAGDDDGDFNDPFADD